jgi:hypothetical protein
MVLALGGPGSRGERAVGEGGEAGGREGRGAPGGEALALAGGELDAGAKERREVGGERAFAVRDAQLAAGGADDEAVGADEAVPAEEDAQRRRTVDRVGAQDLQADGVAVARVEVVLARQADLEREARTVGIEARLGEHVARVHADLAQRFADGGACLRVREELVAPGDDAHRHGRKPARGLGAAHDRVEESVLRAARRGEGLAIERRQLAEHLVQLSRAGNVEEDRLRARKGRQRRRCGADGKARLVAQARGSSMT